MHSKTRPIVTDVEWSVSVCVCVCVCVLITTISCAKTAEPVEVPFGVQTTDM